MQTPTLPENLAYPTACNAHISSCRAWMNAGESSALPNAATMPLMPSPG